MENGYRSEAMQVIHEDMKGMKQLGIINDERMQEFDEMCFVDDEKKADKTVSPVEIRMVSG